MCPSTDSVELWLVDTDRAALALETLECETPRLSAEDESRFAALPDVDARRQQRVAHIALRLLHERAFGADWRRVAMIRPDFGKPIFAAAPGAFSLSHSAQMALIGVARRGRIGVDIERIRPYRVSDDRRLAIEDAAVALAGGQPLEGDRDGRLVRAWVRLEAVAKAEGCGIGALLTRVLRDHDAPSGPLPGLAVHDVAVGEGLMGAAALAPGGPPAVLHLPQHGDGLLSVLSGSGATSG